MAAAVFAVTPVYVEASASPAIAEDSVSNLIHELRQPLSSIEAIAYYLEMTLPVEQSQARLYMLRLQKLVEQTSAILERAASEARAPQA